MLRLAVPSGRAGSSRSNWSQGAGALMGVGVPGGHVCVCEWQRAAGGLAEEQSKEMELQMKGLKAGPHGS